MDPKVPKKPVSAFVSFSMKERPKVKTEFPDLDVKTTNQVLRDRWSVLPHDRKEIYEAKYRVDKTNYHNAIAKHLDMNQKPKANNQTVSNGRKQDTSTAITKAKGMSSSILHINVPVQGDESNKIVKVMKCPAKDQKDKVPATKKRPVAMKPPATKKRPVAVKPPATKKPPVAVKSPVVKKPTGNEKAQKGNATNTKNSGKAKKAEATKRKKMPGHVSGHDCPSASVYTFNSIHYNPVYGSFSNVCDNNNEGWNM